MAKINADSRSEIASIRLDKDQDFILISVGLYRLFLSAGPAGREAKDLYEHLIFTARLQETQQVKANNVYLGRGLCWGQAKVKAAKAWLYNAGLIDYVQTRNEGGQLGEVYIKLSFLPRSETVAERMKSAEDPIPADIEEFRDDLTPDLFSDTEETTAGSDIDPAVTGGSIYRPAVNRTPGSERQMLKVNNEMLEVKKGKEEEPANSDTSTPETVEPENIANAWFARYASETKIKISPRPDDYRSAAVLFSALSGDLCGLPDALDAYFRRFRDLGLWFAARKDSRRGSASEWIPEWSFRSFLAHYPEILAAAGASQAVPVASSVNSGPCVCPVCGGSILGTMGSCGACGFDSDSLNDSVKIEDHREWYERKKRGQVEEVSIMTMFRDRIAEAKEEAAECAI
jgi:hypothetical protein